MNKRFFIFVEDPGAANMVFDLPDFFQQNNFQYEITASKYASTILTQKKIRHTEFKNINQAIDFIDKKKYYAFLIGTSENPKSLGLELIDYGKKKMIKTIGLVDMLTNASERFKGETHNPLQHKPDLLFVTDQFTKTAYINLGINQNNIFVCKHPQEERINNLKNLFQEKFPRKNQLSKRWLFVSENIDLFNPDMSFKSENYTLSGRGKTNWRTGIVLEEVIDALKNVSPQSKLVVRLHPKNELKQFKSWQNEITFDNYKDPLESVWKADFVLGMSSNLLIEAIFLGKNVLSILPRYEEKEWMSELKNGLIPTVFDRKELVNKLINLSRTEKKHFKKEILDQEKSSIEDLLISV